MIKREIGIFLLVGVSAVLVDFISYKAMVYAIFMPYVTAKTMSFILGTIVSYFGNRLLTFGHQKSVKKGSVFRFILLYVVALLANIGVNSMVLYFVSFEWSFSFAFLCATFVSASLNFIGMKYFVFCASK